MDENSSLIPDEDDITDSAKLQNDQTDFQNDFMSINKWAIIPSLWCGAFLAALDSTIITATYTVIGTEFKKSEQASWIATLYMLSSSAFQPLYGGLSDMFGRKIVLVYANAIFLLGSFGCYLAQTMTQLLVARVVAGIGGAGLGTLSSIIVSDLVPLKERSTYNGFANLVFGIGQVIGAPVGGYLADSLGWRYAFLIQCPITAISILIIHYRVRLPVKSSARARLRDIDFVGSIFLIGGVILALLALQFLKSRGASQITLLTLCCSICCFMLTFYVESVVQNPIILIKVLLSRNPLLSGLTNFFGYMGFFSITFNIPLFLQVIHDEPASKAGSRLITSVVGMCVGSLTAGVITRKTKRYYELVVLGVICELVGSVLVSTFLQETASWKFQLYLFPSGLGHGLVLSSTLMAIISSVKKSEQAKATSMSYLFRVLGSAFGVSLTSTLNSFLLRKRLTVALENIPGNKQITDKVMHSFLDIRNLPQGIRSIVKQEFAGMLHTSFSLVILIEFVSLSFAVFIKQYSLDR